MSTTAGLISFKAREGKGAEVAERIAAALPHVNAEEGTPHWLVIRSETSPETVFLVDLFSSTDSRELHQMLHLFSGRMERLQDLRRVRQLISCYMEDILLFHLVMQDFVNVQDI